MATASATPAAAPDTLEERLSALLSSPSQFSVASYLNLALASPDDDNKNNIASSLENDLLQRRMTELALQLQLQTQVCHEEIGRIGAELQAILPRCAADIGRVGVGLEGMRIDAVSLLESTSVSEEEVSSSLETLSTLHALQSNLTRTKEILTAAATWDSTLSNITNLLAQQALSDAVAALQTLEAGERALRGMPHMEERQAAIRKLRGQVQVLLQPQLQHALQSMHTRLAPLQQCVALYTKLNNLQALQDEYVKNRPSAIHKLWFSYAPYQHRRAIDTATSAASANSSNEPHEGEEEEDDEQDDLEHNLDVSETSGLADAFANFLPTWYDSILSLLTEERRQALAVFGPDLATQVIVKVLAECFRPILSSFQSRLESLFPSNSAAPPKGSLESIAAVYESTLQFLSLAYESVAGAWLDIVESGHQTSFGGIGKTKAALNLYDDLISVLMHVASPFAPYQEQLPRLEAKHSKVASQLIARDVAKAVTSTTGSHNLASMQDATERLASLSGLIFPLTQGALARFELLNGGYRVTTALSTIDMLLLDHEGELAIAIQTLSHAVTFSSSTLSAMAVDTTTLATNNELDEQHVLCALEVLKMAGTYCRDLKQFEHKTRERLGVLRDRMAARLAEEKEMEVAVSGTAGAATSGVTSFILPDSLSAVEIDSILTKAVCGDADETETNASYGILQRLTAASDVGVGVTSWLYPKAQDGMARLASACHHLVFDVCSFLPRRHLGDQLSSMPTWQEESSGLGGDHLDSYGTLPQPYITQVGEHMLALVQALEPFASEPESLALANLVMGGIRKVPMQPWREFVAAAGLNDSDETLVETLMNGKDLADYLELENEEEEAADEGDKDEAAKASAAFCNAWLDVVGLAVTGRLLERILRIPRLTSKGCEHLSADLNYLVNVFSALGVSGHPHPLLAHFGEVAILSNEELKAQIESRDRSNPIVAAIRAGEVRIAIMRGISIN